MDSYRLSKKFQGESTYLEASFENPQSVINYQMNMITVNKVAHLLGVLKRQTNDDIQLWYNITQRCSLKEIIEQRKLKKHEFVRMMSDILKAESELVQYQLINKGIVIDPEYIYIREKDFDTELLYIPIYNSDHSPEENIGRLKSFFMDFVINSRIETTGDNFIQQLIDLLNDTGLTEKKLREFVSKNKRGATPEYRKMGSAQPSVKRNEVKPERPKPEFEPHTKPPITEQKQLHPQMNKTKETAAKKAPTEAEQPKVAVKKEKGSSIKTVIFLLINAVIVLAMAAGYVNGIFGANGTINIQMLGAVLLIAAAVDFVVYRELFINSKDKKDKANNAAEQKSNPNAKKSPFDSKSPVSADVSKPQKADVKKSRKTPPMTEKPAYPQKNTPVKKPAPYVAPAYEQEDDSSTVVMDVYEDDRVAYLEYYDNGLANRIYLQKNNTLVGKQKNRVDYSIASDKVSKVHAEFIVNNGRYYVMDYNSTNGTRINGGQRIQPNTEVEIFNGDIVKIANVEMLFCEGQ